MHLSTKMLRALKTGRAGIALAAVAVSSLLVSGPAFASPAPAAGHQVQVHPTFSVATQTPGAALFSCQGLPIDGSQGTVCYSPQQIQKAYGITPLLNKGITGKGRTIAIIDAFSNPYVASDLAEQDAKFGLPAASYSAIAPQGVPAFDATNADMLGWAEEITLDVLWSHAAAPGAKILLVESKSDQDVDIYNATKYVVDHNLADVISQSFGEADSCVDSTVLPEQHAMFAEAAEKGITVFASSGDSGAAQFNCAGTGAILSASSPASDPLVTGVGGTTLAADINGNYQGETAWTEPAFGCNPPALDANDINCSGGGFSSAYARPFYQVGVPNTRRGARGEPDVSYDAGVNGGVLTRCSVCNIASGLPVSDPIFFFFGGTSSGSPQWAAITTLGDQLAHRRLGFINPALYRISESPLLYKNAFHDIKTGNNDVAEIGNQGYNAAKNWDAVTGLGSPNAAVLEPLLALYTYATDAYNVIHNHGQN